MTPKLLAEIKPSKPVTTQEATTAQLLITPSLSERKPDQTSQEEAEQKEHHQAKQDADTS